MVFKKSLKVEPHLFNLLLLDSIFFQKTLYESLNHAKHFKDITKE